MASHSVRCCDNSCATQHHPAGAARAVDRDVFAQHADHAGVQMQEHGVVRGQRDGFMQARIGTGFSPFLSSSARVRSSSTSRATFARARPRWRCAAK
jgi:folate-dependent tRNA-U54 methylase TrmFO/GidA